MTAAILDHLWQSTLVALAAGLLTLAVSRASAGVRYRLWFAASIKFLLPFAALAALGRYLAPAVGSPGRAAPEAVFIQQAVQPLSQFPFAHVAALHGPLSPSSPQAYAAQPAVHVNLPLILLAVWALGSAAVLIVWLARWAKVRAIVRSAAPLPWSSPMPVLASASLMEPGLIGLWRPVLLVPQTLPDHLSQREIDAILAHEACHLRRRDNLTSALHMLVETLFWFHPLVWWIGARLIQERERACDEAVVQAGHDRAVYARSLLESCRLYLQSPLGCVAGASGSNLKARVETIMTAPLSLPLSPLKKTLLLASGVCAFATPVAAGLLASPAGQTVVARAVVTFKAWPDRPSPTPDNAAPVQPLVLARDKALLGAAPRVAGTEAAPLALARDVPIQLAELALPAAAQTPQSSSAPSQPASPPPLSLSPAEAREQAASFVRSYAEATAERHVIARWQNPLCVRVVGLTPDQAAAVRIRIEDVAKAVSLGVQPPGCKRSNIEIGFTTEPQQMLDRVIAGKDALLGDRTSDTRAARTVTLPIQAWYQTNGTEMAQNILTDGPMGMKVPVVYQAPTQQQVDAAQQQAGMAAWMGEHAPSNGSAGQPSCCFPGPGWLADGARQFLNVFVIVDLRRTGDRNLGLLTDYVAMLVLSQAQSLERCNVLPSVTDLYAGACPRAAPNGLTAADAAFLTALYAPRPADAFRAAGGQRNTIAQTMGAILATTKVASR